MTKHLDKYHNWYYNKNSTYNGTRRRRKNMYKLIGFLKKEGNFLNKDSGEMIEYNNTELYLITDEKEDVVGLTPIAAKAKTEELQLIGAKDLNEALNKEVYPITDLTAKPDENGRMRMLVNKLVVVR